MRHLWLCAFSTVAALLIGCGCSRSKAAAGQSVPSIPDKVEAEFISREVTAEELKDLGFELTPEGNIQSDQQVDE